MKFLRFARHWIWLAPLALGVVFIAAGIYMVLEGRAAHDEVRDAIVAENITTAEDAAIPNVLIDSPDEAKAQSDAIEQHYLKATGGKTYSELDREDPLRDTAFRAAALRTSLNLAVMGFKVSDLVVGMGAFMVVIAGVFVLVLAPAVYYSAELANHYAEIMKKQEREKGQATPPVPAT